MIHVNVIWNVLPNHDRMLRPETRELYQSILFLKMKVKNPLLNTHMPP